MWLENSATVRLTTCINWATSKALSAHKNSVFCHLEAYFHLPKNFGNFGWSIQTKRSVSIHSDQNIPDDFWRSLTLISHNGCARSHRSIFMNCSYSCTLLPLSKISQMLILFIFFMSVTQPEFCHKKSSFKSFTFASSAWTSSASLNCLLISPG